MRTRAKASCANIPQAIKDTLHDNQDLVEFMQDLLRMVDFENWYSGSKTRG